MIITYRKTVKEKELLNLISELNSKNNVNGILVQLPLPKHINEQKILDSIAPNKDADGFHPLNVGRLSIASHNDENLLIPCTPYGVLLMLKETKHQPYRKKRNRYRKIKYCRQTYGTTFD